MIKFWSYKKEYSKLKKIIIKKIDTTISKGETFFGKELISFEKKFTSMYKSNYGIAVGSGTDALLIALRSINIKKGDASASPPKFLRNLLLFFQNMN